MDGLREIIESFVKDKPKHFAQMIARNEVLLGEIKHCTGDTIAEKVFQYLNPTQTTCSYGNNKPFANMKDGYRFCGTTGKCQCAKKQVSERVHVMKQSYTQEQKDEINSKRLSTTFEKYGVTNNGQTETAKKRHLAFYSDQQNIDEATRKNKQTKKERYGDENYNNISEIKTIMQEKFSNVDYYVERYDNEWYAVLKDKEKLFEYYPKYSVQEISEMFGISQTSVYKQLAAFGFRDPYKSSFEKEIEYWLRSVGIDNIETNRRKIIGKELDIFLPDYNVAIEYNGIYWHHDKIVHITKDYHYNKFRLCEENGIQLLTIFSNEWDSKKELIKAKILSVLGVKREDRIFAKHTAIKEITSAETKDFLNKTHIQGYVPAMICVGLFEDNVLVVVMTFSTSRTGIGKVYGENAYELVRFATSKPVVGGAERLLTYFKAQYKPEVVYSYSSNEFSVGKLYQRLGFVLGKNVKPGYWYYNVQQKKNYHRYSFTKHSLVKKGYDPDKTEFEIMDELGYLRIWDCGKKIWILRCN